MGISNAFGTPGWLSGKPASGPSSHERRIGLDGEITLDPTRCLPRKSFDKLQELKLFGETENGRVRALAARKDRARLVIVACNDEIKNLTGSMGESRRDGRGYCLGLPVDHPHVVAALEQGEEAKADLASANSSYNQAMKDWSAAQSVAANCEEYVIHNLRHKKIAPQATAADVSLKSGETVIDGIERHRRRGRELDADAAAVRAAPIHSSQAKRQAAAEISALAERGVPDVLGLVERGEPIRWPEQEAPYALRMLAPTTTIDAVADSLGVLAFLFKAQLVAAINKEIDGVADDKAALSLEQRKERLETIRRDRYETNLQEEALVIQALESGLRVSRRADADPRALLGLSFEVPEPAGFGS